MLNDVLQYKWNKFVEDTEKPTKSGLRIYISTFVMVVNKEVVDTTVVANRIRAILNVTTVAREDIGTATGPLHKGFFHIKFVLEPYEDLNTYLVKVLKKELYQLDGVKVLSYRGTELVDVGK